MRNQTAEAGLANAIPIPALPALLDGVGRDAGMTLRRSTILHVRARVFRVTALALDPWPDAVGEPIALLFDDVSDLVRLADASERNDARMAALFHTVDAAMWALDTTSWTIELMSASVLTLTGFRDLYFVGRDHAFVDCVHAADRERFKAYCETLPVGARGALEHRMVRADGQQIWVRTALRKVSQDTREPKVFGVTVDTTHERLAEQRRQERDLAEFSNRAKLEFLATMSHDIRTPLNGVIGMLDYLLESRSENQLGSDATAHIRTAQRSAVELLDLLNDILDISRLEAGRMDLHPERFDLVALAESLQALFEVQASAKGVRLEIALDAALPSGWIGDAPRIRQVLANLVGNAVKFTAQGHVRLRGDVHDGMLRLRVEDTGMGIPEDKRAGLFQPFTQAHVSWGGTGLGLSICKRLAELMGGDVAYEAPQGGGSCFVVHLTLHVATPAALPAGDGRHVVSLVGGTHGDALRSRLEAAGWVVDAEPTESCVAYFIDDPALLLELPDATPVVLCGLYRPVLPGVPRRGAVHALSIAPLNEQAMVELLQGLRTPMAHTDRQTGAILVAQDNEVRKHVVRLMLERLGFDVDIAVNGRLAIDAARRKRYALVLMDMLMPEVDGLEASRRIRAEGTNMRTPIVALTANAYASAQDEALAAGMDAVLTKPLQMQALQHMVARYVPGTHAGQARGDAAPPTADAAPPTAQAPARCQVRLALCVLWSRAPTCGAPTPRETSVPNPSRPSQRGRPHAASLLSKSLRWLAGAATALLLADTSAAAFVTGISTLPPGLGPFPGQSGLVESEIRLSGSVSTFYVAPDNVSIVSLVDGYELTSRLYDSDPLTESLATGVAADGYSASADSNAIASPGTLRAISVARVARPDVRGQSFARARTTASFTDVLVIGSNGLPQNDTENDGLVDFRVKLALGGSLSKVESFSGGGAVARAQVWLFPYILRPPRYRTSTRACSSCSTTSSASRRSSPMARPPAARSCRARSNTCPRARPGGSMRCSRPRQVRALATRTSSAGTTLPAQTTRTPWKCSSNRANGRRMRSSRP